MEVSGVITNDEGAVCIMLTCPIEVLPEHDLKGRLDLSKSPPVLSANETKPDEMKELGALKMSEWELELIQGAPTAIVCLTDPLGMSVLAAFRVEKRSL